MNLLRKPRLDDTMNAVLVALFLALVPVLWIDSGHADRLEAAAASAQIVATAPIAARSAE